jgi:hypothetical protein
LDIRQIQQQGLQHYVEALLENELPAALLRKALNGEL